MCNSNIQTVSRTTHSHASCFIMFHHQILHVSSPGPFFRPEVSQCLHVLVPSVAGAPWPGAPTISRSVKPDMSTTPCAHAMSAPCNTTIHVHTRRPRSRARTTRNGAQQRRRPAPLLPVVAESGPPALAAAAAAAAAEAAKSAQDSVQAPPPRGRRSRRGLAAPWPCYSDASFYGWGFAWWIWVIDGHWPAGWQHRFEDDIWMDYCEAITALFVLRSILPWVGNDTVLVFY
eukprot:SAG22_NODE_28_length_28728_cov_19.603619_4_plen_231_part_00